MSYTKFLVFNGIGTCATVFSSLKDPNRSPGGSMEFKVGDKVVYPNHGVGVIEEVLQTQAGGVDQAFFNRGAEIDRDTLTRPAEHLFRGTSDVERSPFFQRLASAGDRSACGRDIV